MSSTRVPLYARLPEIYRIRDAEQTPPDQLRAFLAAVEQAFSAVHENIEALYQDFFIDTCDDWVVPYIADLLGTTHLKGDPRTLRADVADTIALPMRRALSTPRMVAAPEPSTARRRWPPAIWTAVADALFSAPWWHRAGP